MIAVLAWAAGLVGAASILACGFFAVVFGLGWRHDRRAKRACGCQPRIETRPGTNQPDLDTCQHILAATQQREEDQK